VCGRYASFLPAEATARILGTVNPLPNLAPHVAPTLDAAVVRRHRETGARHLDLLTWGLLPYWTKGPSKARRPINARSETAATSGMFKDALARRRCLVPADAFYEWRVIEGGKQPYAIARQDRQPIAGAGDAGHWRALRLRRRAPQYRFTARFSWNIRARNIKFKRSDGVLQTPRRP
jgi:putative SOS response-associated peptidase YedK